MGKDKENKIVDVTGVENTEGVTVPGVTAPTAAPIAYGAGIENLGYDDWAAINVKDTTADYKNAQAALDLNYKTEMATYGENAERMYQMGLSGSGVSDIYGANAYSAYLAASNDLKLRQIEEQKANRQSWEKYRRDQEEKSRLQHAQVFSSLADQYSEDVSGVSNENALRASMAAQGMSKAEVDAVMNDIKSYWTGNASVRDANHKAVIDAGYAMAYGLFDVDNAEEVKQVLIANNFSEADADEIMRRFYETDENGKPKLKDTSALPMVKAKEEADTAEKDAAKQNAFAYMLEQYNAGVTDTAKLAQQAAALFDLDEAAMGEVNEKFAPFAKTEEEIQDINIDSAVAELTAAFTNADGTSSYTGGAGDNERIRQWLERPENAQYRDYADQIIQQMKTNLDKLTAAYTEQEVTTITDAISNVDEETVTIGELTLTLEQAKAKYGKDSEEYKTVLKSTSEAEVASFTNMISKLEVLESDTTAERLNITAEEWAKMDIDDKEDAVMNTAAELAANGEMLQEDFAKFVSEKWLGAELDFIIEDDKKKARAVGLKDSGGVVSQLLDWKDSGALTEEAYNQMLGETVKKMGFVLDGNKISWGSNGEDATFSLNAKEQSSGTINVTDAELIKKLNKAKDTKGYAFVDGKMYYSNNVDPITKEPIWYETYPEGVKVTGDGVFNTKADREGIYEILKYMLSPERKYVTPGGEGQSKPIELDKSLWIPTPKGTSNGNSSNLVNSAKINTTQLNRNNANAIK